MKKKMFTLCVVALCATTAAYGGVITTFGENPGTPLDVIGVTGFATLGSDMAGLNVVVNFGTNGLQTCTWAALTATSGGCGVAGLFEIVQDGDTFNDASPWILRNLSTFDTITGLGLDGAPGRASDSGVVFDRTFGAAFGTDGSALGKDANGTTTNASNGTALYDNLVGIGGNPPVGDLFTTLFIRFDGNGLGAGETASFVADTDTIGVFQAPEPATISLLGIGLAGLMLRRRSVRA